MYICEMQFINLKLELIPILTNCKEQCWTDWKIIKYNTFKNAEYIKYLHKHNYLIINYLFVYYKLLYIYLSFFN